MYLSVSSFDHPNNEIWISPLVIQRVPSPRGRDVLHKHRWTVHGVVLGTSQADLTSKLEEREAAYNDIRGDVTFKEDDGTATAHTIPYANTVNGIRAHFSYPGGFAGAGWGAGAEYVDGTSSIKKFTAQIEADVLAVEDNILLYHQTFTSSLVGFDYEVVPALTGPPQFQIVSLQSPFWAVQEGYAVGMYTNPTPLGPLVNVPPKPMESYVRYEAPKNQGTVNNWAFGTRWKYAFESPGPLNAVPPPNP